MWRSIIPLVVSLVLSVNLWIEGDVRTRRFVVLVYAILSSLVGVSLWAERHREHALARLLLKARGPRTDGPIITRSEGYRAAYSFLRFGILALVLLFVVVYFLGSARSPVAQTTLLVLLPFLLLPAGMGLLGRVYLLARARFRN